jgi:hypothetical protein
VYYTRNFSARRPTSFCNWKEPTPILLITTYQSPSKNGEKEMNDPEAVTEPDPYKEGGHETFDTKESSEPDV